MHDAIVGDPKSHWPAAEPPTTPAPPQRPMEFPPLVGYRSLEPGQFEGYVGPEHGPVPQTPLVQKSYVQPIKPQPPTEKSKLELGEKPKPDMIGSLQLSGALSKPSTFADRIRFSLPVRYEPDGPLM